MVSYEEFKKILEQAKVQAENKGGIQYAIVLLI